MILFNLDNLLEDIPESKRKEKLDAASHAIYKKIIEQRLVQNPAAVVSMLEAPAIRRVLLPEELERYVSLARNAIRDDELRQVAVALVEEGIEEGEAGRRIREEFDCDDERERVLELFGYYRYMGNRRKYLATILNIQSVWREVSGGGYSIEAIPAWVRRSDPLLLDFLVRSLERRERCGGGVLRVGGGVVCSVFDSFDPVVMAERLADEGVCYDFVYSLCGPDSEEFGMVLRFLLGECGEGDRCWRDDVLWARRELFALYGEDVDAVRRDEFLGLFIDARRIALQRQKVVELSPIECYELISKCLTLIK